MVWKCIYCCNPPKSVLTSLCHSVPPEAKPSDRQWECSNSLIFALYPILFRKNPCNSCNPCLKLNSHLYNKRRKITETVHKQEKGLYEEELTAKAEYEENKGTGNRWSKLILIPVPLRFQYATIVSISLLPKSSPRQCPPGHHSARCANRWR